MISISSFFAPKLRRSIFFVSLILGLMMIAVAIYYQYVLDFYPCRLCVQIRAVVVGIVALSFIGFILPGNTKVLRLNAAPFLSFGIFSLYALMFERNWELFRYDLLTMRGKIVSSSCEMNNDFPDWMPLDLWLPDFFMSFGSCSGSPTMIFSWFHMSTAIVFAAPAIPFLLFLLNRIFGKHY